MAVNANYFTFLFLGFTLWVKEFSAPVVTTGVGFALEGLQGYQRDPDLEDAMERMVYFTTYDDLLNDCRNKVATSLNNGLLGYSSPRRPIVIACDRIDIVNLNGLTIKARNYENSLRITSNNNKFALNDNVVCDDVKKRGDKATYQRSSDGTYWYTNLNVGKPMTQAEIDRFERVWAEDERALEDLRLREQIHRKRREQQFAEERAAQEKAEARRREQKAVQEKVKAYRREQRRASKKKRQDLLEITCRERAVERERRCHINKEGPRTKVS